MSTIGAATTFSMMAAGGPSMSLAAKGRWKFSDNVMRIIMRTRGKDNDGVRSTDRAIRPRFKSALCRCPSPWTAIGQGPGLRGKRKLNAAAVLRKNREALSSKMGNSYPPEKVDGDKK